MLNLLIHEHDMSLYLFSSSLIYFSITVLYFSAYKGCTCLSRILFGRSYCTWCYFKLGFCLFISNIETYYYFLYVWLVLCDAANSIISSKLFVADFLGFSTQTILWTVLFLPFWYAFFICLFFYFFLALLHWLRFLVLYWIGVERADILALHSVLKEKHSVFQYEVWYYLWIFYRWSL